MKLRLLLMAMLLCVGMTLQAQTLTSEQIEALKAVKVRSERKAAPLALRLAATARKIYDNMLADREDQALRRKLEGELERIAGKLLAIKGQSIREMVSVLTPEQKKLLKTEMRRPGAPADLSELIAKLFAPKTSKDK